MTQSLWRGNCASLELVTREERRTLVLHTSPSYDPAILGGPLSNEEARALGAVLLEFARDK